eukprot:s61_g16.t1
MSDSVMVQASGHALGVVSFPFRGILVRLGSGPSGAEASGHALGVVFFPFDGILVRLGSGPSRAEVGFGSRLVGLPVPG